MPKHIASKGQSPELIPSQSNSKDRTPNPLEYDSRSLLDVKQ